MMEDLRRYKSKNQMGFLFLLLVEPLFGFLKDVHSIHIMKNDVIMLDISIDV